MHNGEPQVNSELKQLAENLFIIRVQDLPHPRANYMLLDLTVDIPEEFVHQMHSLEHRPAFFIYTAGALHPHPLSRGQCVPIIPTHPHFSNPLPPSFILLTFLHRNTIFVAASWASAIIRPPHLLFPIPLPPRNLQ